MRVTRNVESGHEGLNRSRKDQTMPSKIEIAHIRQATSAARLRIKKAQYDAIKTLTSASQHSVNTKLAQLMGAMEASPLTPSRVRRLFSGSPSPNRGRFAVPSNLAQESYQEDLTEIYVE
ncbi:hypothetical protein GcM3_209010 [Golovinomyces cichoracearum]|uniref:Uncharacterized protein n=1 Tax=Golovinomyces cichoracearum TaxID=62708 RepID=A0A420HAE7_9PEZI|nr:hypothetical protein GcM3_209010 [Golovinomyces cichoracearum]